VRASLIICAGEFGRLPLAQKRAQPGRDHNPHATILALLGMDHTKLTYLFNGRNFRLTDVAGEVVRGIIA